MCDPGGAGLGETVVEAVVEAVVAEPRGLQRPVAELLVQVRLERLGEAVILVFGLPQGGVGQGCASKGPARVRRRNTVA